MLNLNQDCSLAFLSWKAPVTLHHTLKALFSEVNVSDFSDALIYFQEMSEADAKLADEFGLRALGNSQNVGIRDGIKHAVENARSRYVLFLENDCRLLSGITRANVITQLSLGMNDVFQYRMPVMRFRHRFFPGEDYSGVHKFSKYWPIKPESDSFRLKMKRKLRPKKAYRLAGQVVYVDKNPEARFAQTKNCLSRLPSGNFKLTSAILPWTNQSILVDRERFLKELIPYAEAHPTTRNVNKFPDLEKELNCGWWRRSNFSIGVSDPGLFGHCRHDRPKTDEKSSL